MGNIGWSGIIIVAVLVVLLFGRGKISSIMGDVAKGIKSFKKVCPIILISRKVLNLKKILAKIQTQKINN